MRPRKRAPVTAWGREAGLAALVCLAATGCSGLDRRLEEQPLAAEDMPVAFAYGGLGQGRRSYAQAIDPNYGNGIKRMIVDAGREWAIVDLHSTVGDRVYRTLDPKIFAPGMLSKPETVAWTGDGGTVRDGRRPINWQRFTKADTDQSCLALVRNLEDHNQAGLGTWSTQLVTGVYCRDGAIMGDEVPEIARALRRRA